MAFRGLVRLRFSAGHRLPNHPGLCRFPHGHSYQVDAAVAADGLTHLDWIEDFSTVKEIIRQQLDRFDHAFLVDSRDVALIDALSTVEPSKLYIIEDRSPTAEVIAHELYQLVRPELPSLIRIRVWETEQQYGEYEDAPLKDDLA